MAKILCIEDEEDIRQVLVEELIDTGHEVAEAANGKLGLEAILQQKPDLVVSDISMPVMSGHDLLKELRANHPDLADMPFIFLSALADRNHILEGKKLGADDYLTKPIDFELLFATIDSRLQQVQRMNALKEEQFVKIYRSFTEHGKEDEATGRPAAREADRGGPGAGTASTGAAAATAPAVPTSTRVLEAMAKRSGGRVLAGQIQILGLDEIKAALGDRWSRCYEQVRALAESAIRKRLSNEDVFEYLPDQRFLICFGSLDQAEAAAKAQTIAREIRSLILGRDDIDPDMRTHCEIAAEVHEVGASPAEIESVDDVVNMVATRVEQAAQQSRQREGTTIARMVRTGVLQQIAIVTASGAPTPLAIAGFDAKSRVDIRALRNARPSSDELEAELDILRLGKASEAICKTAHLSRPVLFVDISYTTLESRRLLGRYLKVCASLSEATVGRMVLNVRGMPRGVVTSRSLPLLNPIRQYCRQVALELPALTLGTIDPGTLRTPILTGRYHTLLSSAEGVGEPIKRAMAEIRAKKARLLVHDVPGIAEAALLLEQGVDFIAYSLD